MSTEKMQDMKKLQAIYENAVRNEMNSSGLGAPVFRLSPCVLDDGAVIYANEELQAGWWAFRIGWAESRAAIEVELPETDQFIDYPGYISRSDTEYAIESLGLKVKPC